jgi:hypothetical protein
LQLVGQGGVNNPASYFLASRGKLFDIIVIKLIEFCMNPVTNTGLVQKIIKRLLIISPSEAFFPPTRGTSFMPN